LTPQHAAENANNEETQSSALPNIFFSYDITSHRNSDSHNLIRLPHLQNKLSRIRKFKRRNYGPKSLLGFGDFGNRARQFTSLFRNARLARLFFSKSEPISLTRNVIPFSPQKQNILRLHVRNLPPQKGFPRLSRVLLVRLTFILIKNVNVKRFLLQKMIGRELIGLFTRNVNLYYGNIFGRFCKR
jgi:hypothetical protein